MKRRTWRRVVTAVLVGMLASACSPQELAEIFAVNDLSASENPVKVAAGDAAQALEKDHSAQQLVDEGLREKSKDKLLEASDKRPRDPRYTSYLAAYALAEGNYYDYFDWIHEVARISDSERDMTIQSLGLDADSEEARLKKDELDLNAARGFVEAVDWALAVERGRSPVEPKRVQRLEEALCKLIAAYFKLDAKTSVDAPILVLVGGASCPDNE